MEFDELMKKGEEYMKGFQKGRKFAINKYDKILVELWDKMNDIEKKLDNLLHNQNPPLKKAKFNTQKSTKTI